MKEDWRPLLKRLGWHRQDFMGTGERWFRPTDTALGCSYDYAVKTLKRRGLLDPDENLREQKKIAADLLRAQERGGFSSFDDVARLAELVLALDEWMAKGGFPPNAWKQKKT